MLPNMSYLNGQSGMPRQAYQFQGAVFPLNSGVQQQPTGFGQSGSGQADFGQDGSGQFGNSGTGSIPGATGNVDVGQLLAAIFQPVADLLNAARNGQLGSQTPLMPGSSGGEMPVTGGNGGTGNPAMPPQCGSSSGLNGGFGMQSPNSDSPFPNLGGGTSGGENIPGTQSPGNGSPFPDFGGGTSGSENIPGMQLPYNGSQSPDLTGGTGGTVPGFGNPYQPQPQPQPSPTDQSVDQSTQALQILAQNAPALKEFDQDEDGNMNRSELLSFAKSDDQSVSQNARSAATWLAGDGGKQAFAQLDGYGGASKDNQFDLKALPIAASDSDLAAEQGINNGQDALYALNDPDLIKGISRNIEGSDRPVIDFSKLEDISKSDDDQYTQNQNDAAAFVVDHDELKKKLDDNGDGNFFADMIGKTLNGDPSISEIQA